MNILLDTHAYLWATLEPDRLSEGARALILDPANRVHFSAVSAWEIAIKTRLGKLTVHGPLRKMVLDEPANLGYLPLPVTAEHAAGIVELPLYHNDPFDRLLIAQARLEHLVVLTHDAAFAEYEVEVAW